MCLVLRSPFHFFNKRHSNLLTPDQHRLGPWVCWQLWTCRRHLLCCLGWSQLIWLWSLDFFSPFLLSPYPHPTPPDFYHSCSSDLQIYWFFQLLIFILLSLPIVPNQKWHFQMIIYRMDKQQGPPERHRDYTQYPVINRGGTEDEQNLYKTESLFCAAEINTTL